MAFWGFFKRNQKLNNFIFLEAEDHCYPEVYFDVTLSAPVSHKVGKDIELEFFKFMHKWKRRRLYCIQFICLHKVFEESNTVRIAVDFGYCKPKIVQGLIEWLRITKLPIKKVVMHSDD